MVDERFHELFGDLCAAAYEFPSEIWEKSYSIASPRIRVLSPPWAVRVVVLAEEPGRLKNIPKFSDAGLDAYRRIVPPLRSLLYLHLVKHVSGMPGTASVVSDPEADIPLEGGMSPVYVASHREELSFEGAGFVAMKVIPIISTEYGILERSWILTRLIAPGRVMGELPRSVKSGVMWERIGKLMLVVPWIKTDSGKIVEEFFSIYSPQDYDRLLTQVGFVDMLRGGEDRVRQEVILTLKLQMLSPVSRLLRMLDFVAVYDRMPDWDERDIVRRTSVVLLKRTLKIGLENAGEVLFRGDAG